MKQLTYEMMKEAVDKLKNHPYKSYKPYRIMTRAEKKARTGIGQIKRGEDGKDYIYGVEVITCDDEVKMGDDLIDDIPIDCCWVRKVEQE